MGEYATFFERAATENALKHSAATHLFSAVTGVCRQQKWKQMNQVNNIYD